MSSSNKPDFSEEELKSLGLWQIGEQFGKKKMEAFPGFELQTQAAGLTVQNIEDTQKQAYEESFSQGHQAGYDKGLQQGLEEGKNQGFEEGKNQGFEQGWEEGSAKGYKEKVTLLQKQSAEFINLLESLSEPFKTLDVAIEKELVSLSLGIANQLIRREIKIDPGQIVAVIREAINALPLASQQLTLHMHPEDAELVRSSLALDEISPPWKIIEEPLFTRGGCRVETKTSKIDMTVENRLAAIVATVFGGEREQDDNA